MKRTTNKQPDQPLVTCGTCRHFKRDTEGISRRIGTGEFFMGICTKGHHPDSPIKQFADHQRSCADHRL